MLYLIARREQGLPVFTKTSDWVIFGVIVAGAIYGVYGLVTGVHLHLTTHQEHIMATAKGKAKANPPRTR